MNSLATKAQDGGFACDTVRECGTQLAPAMHGQLVRPGNIVQAFEGKFLKAQGEEWLFAGSDGQFSVDPTEILWCFPQERPAPPASWVLLRRAARHIASDLFTNVDRTQAYELLARFASDLLHAHRSAAQRHA